MYMHLADNCIFSKWNKIVQETKTKLLIAYFPNERKLYRKQKPHWEEVIYFIFKNN